MTRDESRAVAFVGVLLLLAIAARVINRPKPVTIIASPVNIEALREAGRSLAKAPPAALAPPRTNQSTRAKPEGPLNLNRATAAELEALPGIGPAMSQRIIAHRDSIGRFEKIEDLDRVKGIGPVLIGKLRPLVILK